MATFSTEKKILITGTHGFVGTRAVDYYKNATSVPSELVRSAGEGLTEFVRANAPDIILNTAAISDIGSCEKDPDASYRANVILPIVLAKASREIGSKLISFSSDQVYTGCLDYGPYCENESLPEPTNVYARHKLEAENRVLDISPDAILLRATWMYDLPMYGHGGLGHANRGNFIMNILKSRLHGGALSFSSLEYRGITYVRQVVSLLDRVFELSGGVYNYGSENELNMFDTAKSLLNILGIDAEIEDNARRRHNLWMNCEKLAKSGVIFDTTEEGFKRCAKDYGL